MTFLPLPGARPPPARRARSLTVRNAAVGGATGVVVAAFAVGLSLAATGAGSSGGGAVASQVGYMTLLALSMAACLARGLLIGEERGAWLTIALGLALWWVGDAAFWLSPSPPALLEGISFFGFYGAAGVGMVLLVRASDWQHRGAARRRDRACGYGVPLVLAGAGGGDPHGVRHAIRDGARLFARRSGPRCDGPRSLRGRRLEALVSLVPALQRVHRDRRRGLDLPRSGRREGLRQRNRARLPVAGGNGGRGRGRLVASPRAPAMGSPEPLVPGRHGGAVGRLRHALRRPLPQDQLAVAGSGGADPRARHRPVAGHPLPPPHGGAIAQGGGNEHRARPRRGGRRQGPLHAQPLPARLHLRPGHRRAPRDADRQARTDRRRRPAARRRQDRRTRRRPPEGRSPERYRVRAHQEARRGGRANCRQRRTRRPRPLDTPSPRALGRTRIPRQVVRCGESHRSQDPRGGGLAGRHDVHALLSPLPLGRRGPQRDRDQRRPAVRPRGGGGGSLADRRGRLSPGGRRPARAPAPTLPAHPHAAGWPSPTRPIPATAQDDWTPGCRRDSRADDPRPGAMPQAAALRGELAFGPGAGGRGRCGLPLPSPSALQAGGVHRKRRRPRVPMRPQSAGLP